MDLGPSLVPVPKGFNDDDEVLVIGKYHYYIHKW